MIEIKKGNNRFYIGDTEENPLAELTFVKNTDKLITIDHTYVSDKLRGQGVAKLLLEEVLAWARTENIKIIPLCSFVKKQMENNEEYHDLLQ